MKLAEALSERADINKRIAQLSSRLAANAKVQEGELPAEDPAELLSELNALLDRLKRIITAINIKNAEAVDDEGVTLTELIAQRDCLRMKISIIRSFLGEASFTVSRGTRSEIIIKSTVDVRSSQADLDKLSKQLRELEMRLQRANWTIDFEI